MPLRLPPIAVVTALLVTSAASAQLRVVTYNSARLQGDTGAFEDVLAALHADDRPGFAVPIAVIVFQEVPDEDLAPLASLVAAASPGVPFAQATYTNSGEDCCAGAQAMFYRSDLLDEDPSGHTDIFTGAGRDADRWKLDLVGYDDPPVSFYIYSAHLRAGQGGDNESDRLFGASEIRDDADGLPSSSNVIYAGDFNLYSNSEPAYSEFLSGGAGQAFDPLGSGSWGGSGNAIKHSQSPLASSNGGLVGGGLDDRFDFLLPTTEWNDGEGLAVIPFTYRSVGNDGQHYNESINAGNNSYYPGDIPRSNALADDIHAASDHLPVIVDMQVPAVMQIVMTPTDHGRVIQNAVLDVQLQVLNFAGVSIPDGADELDYLAIGQGAVSGTASGSVAALGGPALELFPFDTAQLGNVGGSLVVSSASEDAQNANQTVNAVAFVVRPSNPSFDDAGDVDTLAAALSVEADTGVHSIDVEVHNFGHDVLQSALDVDAAGAVDAPFAFDGTLPGGIEAAPATMTWTFDSGGLAPGLYTESVTIETSDEDVPGETTAQITLTLEVTVGDGGDPCPADLTGDGVVGVPDLLALFAFWGGPDGDLTGDGVTGVPDLLALFAQWGDCP